MKLTKTIIMTSFLNILVSFFLLSTIAVAQEDVKEELSVIENVRTEKVELALLLNLPEISDNPNHIITFQDPSGEGVELEIDGQGFQVIKSPYTLPSLGLGKHILTFKFSDEQKTEQMLERNFTIIPRPPIMNPPTVIENEIKISGTAISNSSIEIFLSREIYNEKASIQTDKDGNWEHTFSENIDEGVYTIVTSVRRNGFSSNLSEPIVFNIGDENEVTEIVVKEEISFSFNNIDFRNLGALRQNTDLLLSFAGFFAAGALLATILISLINRVGQKKSKRVLHELLKKKTEEQQAISFKEKFEKNKTSEEVIEEEVEKEDDEDVKTLTKEEFLEKFEDFDPDDEEGNEKKD